MWKTTATRCSVHKKSCKKWKKFIENRRLPVKIWFCLLFGNTFFPHFPQTFPQKLRWFTCTKPVKCPFLDIYSRSNSVFHGDKTVSEKTLQFSTFSTRFSTLRLLLYGFLPFSTTIYVHWYYFLVFLQMTFPHLPLEKSTSPKAFGENRLWR